MILDNPKIFEFDSSTDTENVDDADDDDDIDTVIDSYEN